MRERPESENLVVLGKGPCRCSALIAETGDEECRKQEAADLRIEPSTFRCDEREIDQGLRHFLISRTEVKALDEIRGAEREPGLEPWRRLAALYDSLAAVRSLDDRGQIMSSPRVTKIDDLSHALQDWEDLDQRHRERTGDQLPKDMRLAILLSRCPPNLEEVWTVQQHLFLDYAHMRAHMVTAINSRTRGHARKFERRGQKPQCQQ